MAGGFRTARCGPNAAHELAHELGNELRTLDEQLRTAKKPHRPHCRWV